MNWIQKLGIFLLKIAAFFIVIMPRFVKNFIAKSLGVLWFDIFRIRRKIILSNLDIAFPEKTNNEKVKIGRASCYNMGHIFIETAELTFIKKNKKAKDKFSIEGMAHIEKARKKGRGICFLTLHLGNPDFATVGIAMHGVKTNVISKEFSISWLNDLWFGLRKSFGTQFIMPKNSAYHILKALKRNEIVVFVQDQFMPGPHGLRTTFFGKPTGTASGLAGLSFRSKSPVLPVYTYREAGGKTVIVIEDEISFQRSDNYEEDLLNFTQLCNHKLEEIVKERPGQWMWVHRRWKKLPKK